MRLLGYTCRELSGYEMKRAVGFFLLVASLSGNAVHAQFGTPSEHPPTIAVVGSADDRSVDPLKSGRRSTFRRFSAIRPGTSRSSSAHRSLCHSLPAVSARIRSGWWGFAV
jgi:hypothetical protein